MGLCVWEEGWVINSICPQFDCCPDLGSLSTEDRDYPQRTRHHKRMETPLSNHHILQDPIRPTTFSECTLHLFFSPSS